MIEYGNGESREEIDSSSEVKKVLVGKDCKEEVASEGEAISHFDNGTHQNRGGPAVRGSTRLLIVPHELVRPADDDIITLSHDVAQSHPQQMGQAQNHVLQRVQHSSMSLHEQPTLKPFKPAGVRGRPAILPLQM